MSAGREVVGERLAGEIVARDVAGDVAREGPGPDIVAAELVLFDGIVQNPGCGQEDCVRKRGSDDNTGVKLTCRLALTRDELNPYEGLECLDIVAPTAHVVVLCHRSWSHDLSLWLS